jgi:hypothetical protein
MISLLTLSVLVAPLSAQQNPTWEYGRLTLSGGVPVGWSAGDSSGNARALIQAFEERERSGTKRNTDIVVGVMNELSAQGWEFVQSVPQVGFIFRRPRQP